MTERFSRVFSLTNNLYSKGCPIIIEAGALQKDTETGNVLAQIKMKNIGKKVISSCKVKLRAFENNGDEIEGVKGFSYLDLNAGAGDEFGGKTPVFLPDATARSFSISIDEIVYDDNSICSDVFNEWVPIPKQKTVKEYLNKTELIEQYAIEVGGASRYVPVLKDNLFVCGCGTINDADNKKCYKCGKTYSVLVKHLNVESLSKGAAQRIATEKAEKQAADEKRKERNIKIRKISAIVAAIAIFIITASLIVTKVIIPNNRYNSAVELYEKGKYEEAIDEFEALNGYKDSANRIQICKDAKNEEIYVKAKNLCNSGSYEQAFNLFESISDYKDSKSQMQHCTDVMNEEIYQRALVLIKENKYGAAKVEFENLSIYKDSYQYVEYCDLAELINGDLEDTNLSYLIERIHKLKDFNKAEDLITNNKYLSQIKSWKGSWQNAEGEVDEDGGYLASYIIDNDGYILFWQGPNEASAVDWGYFTVIKDELCARSEYGTIGEISVSGNTMTFTQKGSGLPSTGKYIRK